MSTLTTNQIDNTLNFMPEARTVGAGHKGLIASITTFFSAISLGLSALHRYEGLRSRGVSPSEASAKVHAEFYAG